LRSPGIASTHLAKKTASSQNSRKQRSRGEEGKEKKKRGGKNDVARKARLVVAAS